MKLTVRVEVRPDTWHEVSTDVAPEVFEESAEACRMLEAVIRPIVAHLRRVSPAGDQRGQA